MRDDTGLDDLVSALAADLRPVRRLWPPLARAAVWVACAGAMACVLACCSDLGRVRGTLMAWPDMWLSVAGAGLTAILAAVATFQLGVPGRSASWALLPLPGVALWIGASSAGCLRTWFDGAGAEQHNCLGHILLLSIPLSMAMVVMLRRACPLRPNLTAATAGLAIAAAAAALLSLIHPYDASREDFLAHLAAVLALIGFTLASARFRVFAR